MRLPALAVLLVFAVVGCGSDPVVVVGYDKGTASVPVGARLRVDLGTVSESIGDGWFLVGSPDAKVLKDDGSVSGPGCGAGMAGCSHTLYWQFTALAKGSTTIRLRYCYRSRPEKCDAGPGRGPAEPVMLLVTVS
jgi:hypothetical protein